MSAQHNTELKTPLVNICIFARNWNNVNKKKCWRNSDFVKMSRMSRPIMLVENNSESLTLTKLRAQNSSVTKGNGNMDGPKRKGKADPTDQPNCINRSPAIADPGHASIIPVSRLYDQFLPQRLQHLMLTFQCYHMLLLVLLLLFRRQSLGLESPGPGSVHT